MNGAALALDGRPKANLIGRTLWDLTPGLEQTELGAIPHQVMVDRQSRRHLHHQVWPNGHSAWLESRIVPVKAGLAAFYRDVSGERRDKGFARSPGSIWRRVGDLAP